MKGEMLNDLSLLKQQHRMVATDREIKIHYIEQAGEHKNEDNLNAYSLSHHCLAHRILLRPAPSGCLIFVPVSLVHMSDLRHERVIRIWIRQQ